MIAEGVATKADGLSIKVKVNEAEMTLTKVTGWPEPCPDAAVPLCGLDLSTPVMLTDEQKGRPGSHFLSFVSLLRKTVPSTSTMFMLPVPEVRSLKFATQIYKQKVNVTRSEYLPSIALMGSYMATNPSVFNSFEKVQGCGMWVSWCRYPSGTGAKASKSKSSQIGSTHRPIPVG